VIISVLYLLVRRLLSCLTVLARHSGAGGPPTTTRYRRERILGSDHPATLTARNNLASAYQAAGQIAEAIPLYEQALTDCDRVWGDTYLGTMAGRTNLASAYVSAGRTPEATRLYERVLADSTRALGADHPITKGVRESLAALVRTNSPADG
jgi:tetratricopeptide (TPR) repeat protein